MKKKTSPAFHPFLRLICVLMIVLIQLPVVSLGFDFKTFSSPNINLFPATSALNSPALTNSALVPFSNPASITVTDRAGVASPPGVGSPYPSPIIVSGLSGTISDVNVTLSGITAPRPRDLDFLLVAPTGQTFVIMADAGGTAGCGITNVNITLDDQAASLLPNNDVNGCPPDIPISSGSYRPTNIVFGSEADVFPAPAPAGPYNLAAPSGAATFASVFNGLNPNGTWNLYVTDDSLGGGTSTIGGGWSIDITTAGGVAPTTTVITSNINPAQTGQTITFTATVTSSGSPVTAGTVAFTNNGSAIAGCTAVPVNGSGVATCSTTSPQGTRTITATYSGTPTLGTSNGSLTQQVNSPTVVSANVYCNNGGVIIPDPGSADVYPVNIVVSGFSGTISSVAAQINGLTAPRPSNLDFLLVAPSGQAFEFMSDAGDTTTAVNNINLTIYDLATNPLPNGTALTGGIFRPSDYDNLNTDTFPAPAPAVFSRPSTGGSATFASTFGGISPNGTWSIYVLDDGVGGGPSSITGLCINLLSPTAANAEVSGRVLNASGSGVAKASVSMRDSQGNTITATTNVFGYYRFDNVQIGETYVMNVSAKGRTFASRIVSVNDNIGELDFVETDQ